MRNSSNNDNKRRRNSNEKSKAAAWQMIAKQERKVTSIMSKVLYSFSFDELI